MSFQSMSISHGAANQSHNLRYEVNNANVDITRSAYNVELLKGDIQEVYTREFSASLAEYNQKKIDKGHPERVIKDYLKHMKADKKGKEIYEAVVQIGNQHSNPAQDEANRIGSNAIYTDFCREFAVKFPQLKLVNATIHNDEATPHLHISYVPVAKANKTGLAIKNSLNLAIKEMGFIDKTTGKPDILLLNKAMFSVLEEQAAKRGIERVDMGCNRAHLSVREFKQWVSEPQSFTEREKQLIGAMQLQSEIIERQENTIVEVQTLLDRATQGVMLHRPSLEEAKEKCFEAANIGKGGMAGAIRSFITSVKTVWHDHIINPFIDNMERFFDILPANLRAEMANYEKEIQAKEKLKIELENKLEEVKKPHSRPSLEDTIKQGRDLQEAEARERRSWGVNRGNSSHER